MLLLRQATLAVAMALACVESACAMTNSPAQISCTVTGAAKLDPAAGSEEAVCSTIRRALEGAQGVKSVEVIVRNSSRASAVMTMIDGTKLAEVHVASSDGVLKPRTFAMLADGLSAQLNNRTGK